MANNCSSVNNCGENSVKFCPICNAGLRWYNMNGIEKIYMCENKNCQFPFGYGVLKFIAPVNQLDSDTVSSSSDRHNKSSPSSGTSTEIDKLNKICEAEKEKLPNIDVTSEKSEKEKKSDEHIINNEEMKNNLENLKTLQNEINAIERKIEESDIIKNEKWINKLMKLQGKSGVQLVKKQEMDLLKKKSVKPMFGGRKLKIDIDTAGPIRVNVQFVHKDDAQTTTENVT